MPSPQYWRWPIRFPGCVPNSVVLQQMWPPEEVSGLGALRGFSGSRESKVRHAAGRGLREGEPLPSPRPMAKAWLLPLQQRGDQEDLWLLRGIRRRRTKKQQKLIQWLRDEEDEDEEELELDWGSESPSSPHRLPSDPLLVPMRLRAQVGIGGWASGGAGVA